jgi:hypothetical protein
VSTWRDVRDSWRLGTPESVIATARIEMDADFAMRVLRRELLAPFVAILDWIVRRLEAK